MTRDSRWWTVALVASVVTALLGNQDLLQQAGVSALWEARMELLAAVLAAVSGKMATSPLEGREKLTGTGDGTIDPKRFANTGDGSGA